MCSGAWIDGFSSFGSWNFTGCLEFYLGLCEKGPATAENKNLKKYPRKGPKNLLPFFLLPFLL